MSSYSFKKLSNDKVKKIKSMLSKFRISRLNDERIDSFFSVNNVISVSLFKNGTLLIQGKECEKFIELYLPFLTFNSDTKNNIEEKEASISKGYFSDVIGCDESGVGDYFGPVVYASAYVPIELIKDKEFVNLIEDSKKINDIKIKKIYPIITSKIKYAYYINELSIFSEQIDKYKNQNIIKTISYFNLLNIFLNKFPELSEKEIILDQYNTAKSFKEQSKYSELENKFKFSLHTKAESKFIAVAAASIIARFHFCKQLERIEEQYNIKCKKGASLEVKNDAKWYKEMFPNDWHKIIKKNFKL